MRSLKSTIYSILFTFISVVAYGQLPTNVDVGQEDIDKNLWDSPKYYIPVIVIAVVVIGYGLWKRSKRTK